MHGGPQTPKRHFLAGLILGGTPPMAYAYPPTRIPWVAGIQIYGLDRLNPIITAMVVGAR